MNKAAAIAGWAVFLFALVGAAMRTGPDDPMTANLKASGLYQPFLVIMWVTVALLLIWATFMMRRTVKMRRDLDHFKRKGR